MIFLSQPGLCFQSRNKLRNPSFSFYIRILEVVKIKCGDMEAEIWSYMVQELQPTLAELGIPGLAEIGYDQPELALPNPYEIH